MSIHTTSYTTRTSPTLLHRTIQLDALTCTIGAIGFLAVGFIGPLTQLMGFTDMLLPILTGIGLLPYIAWLLWLTGKPQAQPRLIVFALIINALWILGWLAVLLFQLVPLTLLGQLFVGFTVVVVALCTVAQFYAMQKLQASV